MSLSLLSQCGLFSDQTPAPILLPEVIIKAFCLNAADFNLYLWIHKNGNPPNPACGRFKTLEVFKIL